MSIIALSAAATALVGCSAVSDSSTVATVNGKKISRADFDRIAQELIDAKQFTPDATGKISGADSRVLVGALAQYNAILDFLSKNGESITEADRQAVISSIQPNDPYFTWPKDLQELTVDLSAVSSVLSRIPAPSESDLKSMYESSPLSTGQLCMRHILVKTAAEARDVLKQLAEGADFATLAPKVSTDTAANKEGGALTTSTGGACSPLSALQASFDPDFLLGAMSAKVGVPTGPVKSSFGYHVILLRPYEEVATSLSENLSTGAGQILASGFVATSKISVNSKYGTWNKATAKVE